MGARRHFSHMHRRILFFIRYKFLSFYIQIIKNKISLCIFPVNIFTYCVIDHRDTMIPIPSLIYPHWQIGFKMLTFWAFSQRLQENTKRRFISFYINFNLRKNLYIYTWNATIEIVSKISQFWFENILIMMMMTRCLKSVIFVWFFLFSDIWCFAVPLWYNICM